jgi:rhodanese-related sulfurtransferase
MKSIRRDDLRRSSFPGGAHVVEVIAERGQCLLHDHFQGMDCLQLGGLREFARSHPKEEPVLIHCVSEVDCHLATELLEYAGFEQVFRYEGELADLRPYGWRGEEPEPWVELSERAFQAELAREPLATGYGPALLRREELATLIERTPPEHLMLLEIAPEGRCLPKEHVLCMAAGEVDRLGEVLGPGDVVVFSAAAEEAEATYRRLERTGVSAIFRYEGDFAQVRPRLEH